MGFFDFLFGKKKSSTEIMEPAEDSVDKKKTGQTKQSSMKNRDQLCNQAMQAMMGDDWSRCVELLKEALKYPYVQGSEFKDHEVYRRLGFACSETKQYKEAYDYIMKAKELGNTYFMNDVVLDEIKPHLKEMQNQFSSKTKKQSNSISIPQNIRDIITLAENGLSAAQAGNTSLEWRSLASMFNKVQSASSQLLQIPDEYCNEVGSAYALLLSHRPVQQDEDMLRAVTDYAFYLYSRAIRFQPTEALFLKRASIMAESLNYFFYTVANALNLPDGDPFDVFTPPLRIRTNDYMYAMGRYDFSQVKSNRFNGPLGQFYKLCFENEHISVDKKDRGLEYINKVVSYLESSFSRYK